MRNHIYRTLFAAAGVLGVWFVVDGLFADDLREVMVGILIAVNTAIGLIWLAILEIKSRL